MAPRRGIQTQIETRLAYLRIAAGLSQKQLADIVGIPLATYRRLERGRMSNPPIRYLMNLALALNVELEDVCEDEWLWWTVFRHDQSEEPPPLPVDAYEINHWREGLQEAERAGRVPKSARPRRGRRR